jgi:hypothetical protein
MPGWTTGASGNTHSAYVGHRTRAIVPLESTAWIAKNFRYRDEPTADPPNATLAHLSANGLIACAVIYNPTNSGTPLRLDLGKARHLKWREGAYVAGGNYELAGYGPKRAYLRSCGSTSARTRPRASSLRRRGPGSSNAHDGIAAIDDMSSAPVRPNGAVAYRIHQRAGGSRPRLP